VGRLGRKNLIWLCHQLGTMLRAGLPIRRALDVLIKGTSDLGTRRMLREVAADIEQGCSLHDAFERRKGVFTPLFLNLVKAGEESGTLDEVTAELRRYYEMLRGLVRLFWGRILFPVFEYVIAIAVVAGVFYIIGSFIADDESAVAKAKLILFLGYGAPIGLVVLYFLLTRYLGGLRIVHEFLLKIPVIGKVFESLALARFSWALKVMTQAAVPVTEGIPQALAATGNGAFAGRARSIVERLMDGCTLREALEGSRLFPRQYLEIMSVAEESGSLEDTLERLAKNSFESAEFALKALAVAVAWLVWLGVAAVIVTFIFILFRKFYLGPMRSLTG